MEKFCIPPIYGALFNLVAYQGKSLLIPC